MDLFFDIFPHALAGVIYFSLAVSGAISAGVVMVLLIALLNRGGNK